MKQIKRPCWITKYVQLFYPNAFGTRRLLWTIWNNSVFFPGPISRFPFCHFGTFDHLFRAVGPRGNSRNTRVESHSKYTFALTPVGYPIFSFNVRLLSSNHQTTAPEFPQKQISKSNLLNQNVFYSASASAVRQVCITIYEQQIVFSVVSFIFCSRA